MFNEQRTVYGIVNIGRSIYCQVYLVNGKFITVRCLLPFDIKLWKVGKRNTRQWVWKNRCGMQLIRACILTYLFKRIITTLSKLTECNGFEM